MTLRKSLAVAALLACLVQPAHADITLNLKDAEISTLIATVSEVTGKNFIVDARVKGKVTVISSSPMNAAGLYETFLAVLQVNGFAAVPAGDTIKIIPETNARWDGGGYVGSSTRLPMDEVVTHVFALQNVNASQLVPILRPMVPQWGHLVAYQGNNSLIISDRASNVVRLGELIRQMDQAGDREIEQIKLEHAGASEVVRVLTSLTQQDKQADPTSKPATVIADERSNSILIGGDKSERQKFKAIVRQLDVPLKDDGATQVVYLRYASAENLAPILEGYAQQVKQADNKQAGGTAAPAAQAGGGGEIRVLADKDTNALIITAPPKAMRQIRDVVAQLDIQRAQVLVEAVIAEISDSKASELGVDWAVFNGDRIAAASLTNAATVSAIGSVLQTGQPEAALSALGRGINLVGGVDGGSNGTSLGVLLRALKTDGDSNVLSTPTLVTLDNEEAKFSAGQEVPFQTGSFTNTGTGNNGAINPFQTIERKDVGLTLSVTPQISGEGDRIKLKLNLEVSNVDSGSAGAANLVTNKRTLSNVVGVENGQILVIGGLIDDQVQDSMGGIPFLSDIPLIGSLFSSRKVIKLKRNLMLFIRPTILRKQAEGDYYTRKKYEAVRQAQIDAGRGAVPLIGGRHPVLPMFDTYLAPPPPPPAAAPTIIPALPTPAAEPAAN
ncbi:MAG TPA: type II secretion system secretin GspD [Solimonas sp.]|nr:type II secretion system secretin GspD [Solimonas sp.]